MLENIVGRVEEKEVLERLLLSKEPEFLAIYGRRRVGKTFLVKEFFETRCPLFELTGDRDATLAEQLQNFAFAYRTTFPGEPPPKVSSWREAFHVLAATIDRVYGNRRVVLFMDELPWLASHKSNFLNALDHLWNSWGNRRNLVLIVCGSAASWMIGRLLNSTGGLYNRVTGKIRLMPFSLAETEAYLRSRSVNLGRKDVLELYMCLGGIPHYLRDVRRGESVAQAVDRMCFSRDGLLRDELDRVFASLFHRHERHVAVIRALATKRRAVTRQELLDTMGEASGGGMTGILQELEQSAFISCEPYFGHATRDSLYRLVDEHSLFHLKWIEPMKGEGSGYWTRQRNSVSWRVWAGLAFESLCLKHVAQIKNALGIAGVSTVRSGWHVRTPTEGAQIDLVIDRADNCINLCELKYVDREFTVTKGYAENLRRKFRLFRNSTRTRKTPFLTMVTTYGCTRNPYYEELIDAEVTMDALFQT